MTEELVPSDGKTSFSGIPEAQFIEDVDSYMKGEESAEHKLKTIDETHQKYKFMEASLTARRKKLKAQVPDIQSSLAMIKKLREKKEKEETLSTQFLLSDQVYARASVPPTDKVSLDYILLFSKIGKMFAQMWKFSYLCLYRTDTSSQSLQC